jgi:serine/threonine protein kinase
VPPSEDVSAWWPPARAAHNPTARLTAGLALLSDLRRRGGATRGAHALERQAGGHLRCARGMPLLAGRYRFYRAIALGETARTVACEDLFRYRDEPSLARSVARGEGLEHPMVVLKIYSADFLSIGEQESERLRRLNAADPRGEHDVVRQLGRFVLDGRHLVIVLPMLIALVGDLAPSAPPPMPLARVRHVCAHVLHALAFLRVQGVIHADLKPENIMLDAAGADAAAGGGACCGARPVLIDLGNACSPDEARAYDDGALQTLGYRAAELVYGLPGISYPIDMWSLGCVLFELAAGEPLFRATSPAALALEIAELLGQPPAAYARAARSAHILPRVAACEPTRPRAAVALALGRRLLRADGQPSRLRRHADHLLALSDLIAATLEYEPAERIGALGALYHPFMRPFFSLATLDRAKQLEQRGAPVGAAARPGAPKRERDLETAADACSSARGSGDCSG